MDTDTALAVAAGVSMTVCALCVCVVGWRNSTDPPPHMKISRSDPDLENLAAETLPTH